nr:TolC family protein [Lysinibacillus timonensis]
MKKGITMGLAALLVTGSISPAVLAAELSTSPVETLAATSKNDENERFFEKVKVESLSLEDALQYGINSSYSLLELEYTLEQLNVTEDKLDDSYDVAESSLETAIKKRDELKKQIEAASGDTITVNLESELDKLIGSLEEANINIDDVINEPTEGADENASEDGEVRPASEEPTNGLEDSIDSLKGFLEQLQKYVDEYEKYQENQLNQEKLKLIEAQISSLRNTVTTLENTLDDLDSQYETIFNNRVVARESMEVSITSSYLGLVMLQDQINYLRDMLNTQQTQIDAMKVRFDLGLISARDYEKETRSLVDLETQIADLEKKLKSDKATFALTIGITYDEDYYLENPELGDIVLVEQRTATEDLIKNSFNMVNAKNEVLRAEDKLDEVEDIEGRVKEDEELAEIELEIAKLSKEKLEVDLEKVINNLYLQVQQQYSALKTAERELELAKVDNQDLQFYYDLGLLSKHEFESAYTPVKQAEFDYNNAKYQYYLVTKQIELVEAGVIPAN